MKTLPGLVTAHHILLCTSS